MARAVTSAPRNPTDMQDCWALFRNAPQRSFQVRFLQSAQKMLIHSRTAVRLQGLYYCTHSNVMVFLTTRSDRLFSWTQLNLTLIVKTDKTNYQMC